MKFRDNLTYLLDPSTKINVRHAKKKLEQAFKLNYVPEVKWSRLSYLLNPTTLIHTRHRKSKLEQLYLVECPYYLDYNNGKARWLPQKYRDLEDARFWQEFAVYNRATTALARFLSDYENYQVLESRVLEVEWGEWGEWNEEEDWENGYCGDDLPESDT